LRQSIQNMGTSAKSLQQLSPSRKPKMLQRFGVYVGITLGRSMQAPAMAGG
jgi:hypothetical protein